ncbi:hypothetical protein [Massilia eburnea]|uniref:hypothetical protein n=1 Tax=Massilia eburnea TaxID=1776165 RepID=UPI003D6BEBA8
MPVRSTAAASWQVNANGATASNSKVIVSQGEMTLHAGDFNNDGGQLATAKGSGAVLAIDAASISNRSGVIMSDAAATIDSAGKLDNTQGTVQSAGSLDVSAAGAMSNNGGVVEALAPECHARPARRLAGKWHRPHRQRRYQCHHRERRHHVG